MSEDGRSANVTRLTPNPPKLRWHRYSPSQKQIHLKSLLSTSSPNFLSPRNMTRSSPLLTTTAPRHPSSYPVRRRSRQREWRSSLSGGYSDITNSLGRSSVTGTPNLHQSSPESYATSWVSNRTFPQLIILGQMGSQNGPISGWKPTSDSSLTISRTIGQCTCP